MSTQIPSFSGEVLTPADGDRYDAARAVFNAMFDRCPAVIARPGSAPDVASAIAFARSEGLRIAVRGGGHSVAGYSAIDDGLVIDLSAMKSVEVDPRTRRARVGPGVTWGEFDAAAQQHGLATTGGRMTTTGVAGFTLGSGSGWLERLHGYACDNLVSAEVVTASGQIVVASDDSHPELFWGLRGGGGNFGVVTSFEFRLHPIGPMIYAGMAFYPRDRAPEVCRTVRDVLEDAPRELAGGVLLMHAPPAPFIPPELVGQPAVAVVAAYFGDMSKGPEAVAPLKEVATPAADVFQEMPYVQFQQITDAGNPSGRRNYWRSDALRELPDEAIDTFIACAARATSPLSVLILGRLGGAIGDVPDDATAMPGRRHPWVYHCYGSWTEAAHDAEGIAWAKATEQAMHPWGTVSLPLNFASEIDSARIQRTFGADKHARLVAIKDRYDPDNVFRMNQNIRPSGP